MIHLVNRDFGRNGPAISQGVEARTQHDDLPDTARDGRLDQVVAKSASGHGGSAKTKREGKAIACLSRAQLRLVRSAEDRNGERIPENERCVEKLVSQPRAGRPRAEPYRWAVLPAWIASLHLEAVFDEAREAQHPVANLHIEPVRVAHVEAVGILLWI